MKFVFENVLAQVMIILGQPHLDTSNALINRLIGVMKILIGNMTTQLNVFGTSIY